jgi:large subunit ribosomal protein L24
MKIKKGDTVVVIAGKDKGATGEVLRVMPTTSKVLVKGVNIAKRHTKPKTATEPGGIVEKEMPIAVSNVAFADASGKAVKISYKIDGDTKIRVNRKTGVAV